MTTIIKTIQVCLDEVTRVLQSQQDEQERYAASMANLEKELLQLQECNAALTKELTQMQSRLNLTQTDLDDLRKVSQIIAFEKENARLKTYVSILEKRLSSASATATAPQGFPALDLDSEPVLPTVQSSDDTGADADDDASPEEDVASEDEDAFEVYETIIQKKAYYVSTDDDARVYEKHEDGTVGDCVGYLKTLPSGKLRIRPLES